MEKRDFNREFESLCDSLGGRRPGLLLQVCCAPCLSAVLERVYPYFDVTLYYFNPNTHPEEEYEKRFGEIPKLLRASGREDVPIIRGEYDTAAFFGVAKALASEPEGGARCAECFKLRLGSTAARARELGFEYFGTTLTVSPHKNAGLINELGDSIGAEAGVKWLPSDFKKRDGYLRSIRLSREYGLYRQCWCGCVYSRAPAEGAP